MTKGLFARTRPRPALYLLIGGLFSVTPLLAQTSDNPGSGLKGLTLEQLGNIEVTTATRQPVTVNKTPAAIYVITQEDIRRSGATSIPEALRLAPGVEVARIDSVKWAIGIRGFESRLSREILVLIDGRTVYDPSFHGVYWEVQDTLLEDIDRIEVIRGPGGTIWGANAVDGVINIISRSSKDTTGALVSAGGGNVNQGFLNVRYGGSNGKGLDYRVYAKGNTESPESHPNGQQFDDWRRAQAGFRADWQINPQDTLTIQGDIYADVDGESVRVTSLSAPFTSIVNKNAQLSGGNILGRWTRKFSEKSDLQIQTYYDRTSRLQANQAEYRDTFDFDLISRIEAPHNQEITWGLGTRISRAVLPAIVPTYVFSPDTRTDQLYTGFVQDEIPIVEDRFSLTLGSKLIHNSFSGFDVEPSARFLWTPSPRRSFWAAVTRAVRTPSDIENDLTSTSLISLNPLVYSVTQGDGKFPSEVAIGYELGYRRLINSKVSIDIATFYNSYDHLQSLEPGIPYASISPQPLAMIFPYTNGNGLKGNSSGFEIVPNWKPFSWWRLEGYWAYLNLVLRPGPGSADITSVPNQEGSSPRHEVSVKSSLDLPGKIEFSQDFRFVSALPGQLIGSYETADARLAWRFLPHLEFSVTGQNLFQPRHVEYGGDPGALVGIERAVYAAITWRK
ncbi:MAG TPA: TonB-dependent receptor [Bryobacteraceae bacterium]|jgi:iron complex outermembrane receptor protein|nr:TonB-dependent receptor [Bryobacteraceae bacterium]